MNGTTNTLLELRGVSQRYRTGKRQFTAVQSVDLTISEEEFIALLGPSGCGKSTLLRIITGLAKPSEGQVRYRGRALQGVNPYATIVFQTFALFPWLTVARNVEVALTARGVPARERSRLVDELLDRIGLDGFETAYPRELSGGMRQKVGFARAMAVEPELLCLDEPFSALDVLSAEALRGELMELWLGGAIPTKAILLVTHNIEEAILMADRIIIMEKDPGRVVADLRVSLPHPRKRKDTTFLEVVDKVYATLAGQTQPEGTELGTLPGEPGLTRLLPTITINDLAGLLEHINNSPHDCLDIYRLPEEIKVDSDHLLRLTEAAELLGFATISQGDIAITPLGEAFAEAGIPARKDIFASRIRRLPLFKWLLSMLSVANKHQLEWDVVQAALQLEFPREEAERQIDLAVDWGRYAGLLSYDDGREMIYLDMDSYPSTT